MALRTRKKSTCLRTTSSGSVTLITTGSHVTSRAVQDASGIWTAITVTCGATDAATGPRQGLFPSRPPAPSTRTSGGFLDTCLSVGRAARRRTAGLCWANRYPTASPREGTSGQGLAHPFCRAKRGGGESPLAEPAERRLRLAGRRFRRRQVLAVAPAAAGAVLVMVLPARDADHAPIVRPGPDRCATRGDLRTFPWAGSPQGG
jgi:hypothetical protein